ncbi:hypothetical protein E2C01_038795 [Portunus trituberculatus]|uniref:Uncharacterized protein n=1 Tax=Portunus trituberculatus TaxID=210409 RepID=A0A5B7FBT6_PORTR|nr:hypothetical protein [Portunus trituberculatus]
MVFGRFATYRTASVRSALKSLACGSSGCSGARQTPFLPAVSQPQMWLCRTRPPCPRACGIRSAITTKSIFRNWQNPGCRLWPSGHHYSLLKLIIFSTIHHLHLFGVPAAAPTENPLSSVTISFCIPLGTTETTRQVTRFGTNTSTFLKRKKSCDSETIATTSHQLPSLGHSMPCTTEGRQEGGGDRHEEEKNVSRLIAIGEGIGRVPLTAFNTGLQLTLQF